MNIERYTERSRGFIQSAQSLATREGHQQFSTLHLLKVLLDEDARMFTRAELDITDTAMVDRAFAEVEPDVVFNCAAFHNVDVCEVEREQAWRVNVEAVRDLAVRSPLFWSIQPPPNTASAIKATPITDASSTLPGRHERI